MARLAIFAVFLLIAVLTPQADASVHHRVHHKKYEYEWLYPYPATYKLKVFVRYYLKTLESCRIYRIRKFYARDFVTFRGAGPASSSNAGTLKGEIDGIKAFCRDFKHVRFTPLEIVRVAPLVVFARIRVTSPSFKYPVFYSVAMKLQIKSHRWKKDRFVLKRNVLTANGATFADASKY